MTRCRTHLAAFFGGLALSGLAAPAQALERLVLRMPFLETTVTINLGEIACSSQFIPDRGVQTGLQIVSIHHCFG